MAEQSRRRSVRAAASRGVKRGLRAALRPDSPVRRALPAPLVEALRATRRHLPDRLVRVVDQAMAAKKTAAPVVIPPEIFAAGSRRPSPPDEPVRVWVAPANFAGQGRRWSEAMTAHLDGVGARCMAVRGAIRFPVDQEVDPLVYGDARWQREQEEYVLAHYTHVLIEAERPLFGTRYGRTCEVEIRKLAQAGKTVGLISHGSDLRIPSHHAARFPHSPFDDPTDQTTAILQARAEKNAAILRDFGGPVFVSTPDLLDDAPHARWCPTVVDPAAWASSWPLFARAVPRVVHIPSNGRMKGTPFIDAILTELDDAGVVEYRSLRALSRDELRREYQEADIVVDQVVMGLYGVASLEGLAAGRVVLAFVGDVVRDRIRAATGREVPIREAVPQTLREVILDVVGDRDAAAAFAADGPAYVRDVHDGRYSAQVLRALTDAGTRAPRPPVAAAGASPEPSTAPAGPVEGEPEVDVEAPMRPAPPPSAPIRLFVGPANFAGQGTAWAHAAARHVDGVAGVSMAPPNPLFPFPVDYAITAAHLASGPWAARQERYLAELFTHVLIESMRPVTGRRYGRHADLEIARLGEAGLSVALVAHGTDIRVPSEHVELTSWSPFRDAGWEAVPVLEANAARNVAAMRASSRPCFVSTPDLLRHLPEATWLPVVVDPARWTPAGGAGARGMLDRDVPVVVHAPSSSRMKGSEHIDPVLAGLAAEGLVEYRRIEHVPPAEMPAVYGDADLVLDQFVLGSYGVAACEALAAGRLVVGHVTATVRDHVRGATGLDLPIVEAVPDTLEATIRGLLADRDAAAATAAAGAAFVRAVHDGTRSADVLRGWLQG